MRMNNDNEAGGGGEISLATILQALRRYPRLLLCLMALAVVAAVAFAYLRPVQYAASIALPPFPGANAYKWALQSDAVRDKVAAQLGSAQQYGVSESVARRLLATNVQVRGDVIVEIYVRDRSPELAASIANMYLDAAIIELRNMRLTPESRVLGVLEARRRSAQATAAKLRITDPGMQQILETIPGPEVERAVSRARMQALLAEQALSLNVQDTAHSPGVLLAAPMPDVHADETDLPDTGRPELSASQIQALEQLKGYQYWTAMVAALDDRMAQLTKEEEPIRALRAVVADQPVPPSRLRIIVLGGAFGILLAMVAVVVLDTLRRAR